MSRRRRRSEDELPSMQAVIPAPAPMDTSSERGKYDLQLKERGEEEMARLDQAARLILAQMDYDELRRNLLDQLTTGNNGQYQFMETRRLLKVAQSSVPIPQAIADEYNSVECTSFVGLLPEINRAYITVDNKLFLWNYVDGGEFIRYAELTQIIVSVGLVKPKPNIFPKQIKYLLVLATPVEVVLVGLRFLNDDVRQAVTVYSTPFQVPTDNVNMLKIVGSSNGRIFMCGKDGNVYELAYQAEDGFFRKKCRKLNHSSSAFSMLLPSFLIGGAADDPIVSVVIDSSRQPQLLYTLSQRNAIQVWSLGNNGDEMHKLCSNNTVLKEALAQLNRDVPGFTPKDFKIVSVAAIARTEADNTHLVAITQHGHRLFFSLEQPGWGKGYSLRLRFVRLSPPAVSDAEAKQRKDVYPGYIPGSSPKFVRAAFIREGVTLFADVRPAAAGSIPEGDTLVALIPGPTKEAVLNEAVESLVLDARVADITEVDQEAYMTEIARCLYARGQGQPLVGLSEFATQHAMPPRQFLVLTGKGLEVFIKSRPVDELRKALAHKRRSGDETELQQFFDTYGLKEACAMCLIIACAPSESLSASGSDGTAAAAAVAADTLGAPEVALLRSPAERKYGVGALRTPVSGRKRPLVSVVSPYSDVPQIGDPSLAQLATQAFFRYGNTVQAETKTQARGGIQGGVAASGPTSGKLEGLAVYMQRLLRPVWDWTITFRKPGSEYNEMRYSSQQLIALREPLKHLQRFIDANVARFLRDPHRAAIIAAATGPDQQTLLEAQRNERESFEALRYLLAICIEAMSFLVILSTQNFPRIFSRLDAAEQERLRTATFCELVTSAAGEGVVRFLISSMLALAADSKAVIDELHKECPTFFDKADVLHYRAVDCLQKARARFDDRKQRNDYLKQALDYYRGVTRCRIFPLEDIAAYLREVHFYQGVVELALERIRAVEQGDVALPHAPAARYELFDPLQQREVDPETRFIEEERARCYNAVIESLDAAFFGRYRNPAEEKLVLQIPAEERRRLAEAARDRCLAAEDEGFHYAIYKWMLQNEELRSFLMTAKTPYLVPFLESDEQYIDHLLEYYSRNNMNKKAAIMYLSLAVRKGREYSLDKRVAYLNSALQNTIYALGAGDDGSDGYAPLDDTFRVDLEDRKTLAEIQQGIRDRIKTMLALEPSPQLQEILDELETGLAETQRLYEISLGLHLWDWCLRIFHFSEEFDQEEVIKRLWSNLINSAVEEARLRGEAWPTVVRNKIEHMAKQLPGPTDSPHPAVFRVDYILWELENLTYKLGGYGMAEGKQGWVVDTLRGAGVSSEVLMDAYARVIDRPLAELDEPRKLQLISSACYLLKKELGKPQVRFAGVRPAFGAGRDLADRCLTELNALSVDHSLAHEKEMLTAVLRQIYTSIDQTLYR